MKIKMEFQDEKVRVTLNPVNEREKRMLALMEHKTFTTDWLPNETVIQESALALESMNV